MANYHEKLVGGSRRPVTPSPARTVRVPRKCIRSPRFEALPATRRCQRRTAALFKWRRPISACVAAVWYVLNQVLTLRPC